MRKNKEKDNFKIPRSVQDTIPVKRIFDDGIFLLSNNKYSLTYIFSDVNYAVSGEEEKESIFLGYENILKSFDSSIEFQISIFNRKINIEKIKDTLLIPDNEDDLQLYRDEFNDMLITKIDQAGGMVQEKYLTATIQKNDIAEARTAFARLGTELSTHFTNIGSTLNTLSLQERLNFLRDFYRPNDTLNFNFDLKTEKRLGQSFKDYICPDSMQVNFKELKIGDKYTRTLFIKTFPNYLKDKLIAELTETENNFVLSISSIPVATDQAVQEAEIRYLNIQTNIDEWKDKQRRQGNYDSEIPYQMEKQKNEMREFLHDLSSRDQGMFLSLITLTITADSLEELNTETEKAETVARKYLCQLGTLTYEQLNGLKASLPYGINDVHFKRTFTTESLAVLMPFKAQDVIDDGGVYYGKNTVNNNLVLVDRKNLLNGNSFVLGVSGSGKSFWAKSEIAQIAMRGNADILIIDPEREYSPLVESMGGEIIDISSSSKQHINALDIDSSYGDGEDPIILKTEFVLSLCEMMVDRRLTASEKSLIGRVTSEVYKEYQFEKYTGEAPTLIDFYEILKNQPEREAQNLALELEIFVYGHLNTFSKTSNVDVSSHIISYDLLDLGKHLRPIGMLIVLDQIWNRIVKNRMEKRTTYIFIDEIYILFDYEYSSSFLFELWKRVRKYGAFATGITQNVSDLLNSHEASTMLANSELLTILNQAPTDRMELAHLLNIHSSQMSHVTNSSAGHGLLKIGKSIIPVENVFDDDTNLYRLMSTKPNEF